MRVIFDLDGTLANITHRIHHVKNGNRNWGAFFAECVDDQPIDEVIQALHAHRSFGHSIEIWSGRSQVVEADTVDWLEAVGIPGDLLTRMRPEGDYTPDHELKKSWLQQADRDGMRPDVIYDDRKRVVDMWRAEGVKCFQVEPGDFDKPERIVGLPETGLDIMVGPSGAGKSTYLEKANTPPSWVVSSDQIRTDLCGDFKCQSRNSDVFAAVENVARSRLNSGLPTIIDATNLRRRDRLKSVSYAPADMPIRYIVLDRPMDEKIRDGGWRNDVEVKGQPLMAYHQNTFNSQINEILSGDDDPRIEVVDLRQT